MGQRAVAVSGEQTEETQRTMTSEIASGEIDAVHSAKLLGLRAIPGVISDINLGTYP
jgi:hypothetical protein